MGICTLSSSFISWMASLNIVLKNIKINVEIRMQYYFRPLTMAKVLQTSLLIVTTRQHQMQLKKLTEWTTEFSSLKNSICWQCQIHLLTQQMRYITLCYNNFPRFVFEKMTAAPPLAPTSHCIQQNSHRHFASNTGIYRIIVIVHF